MDFTDSPEIAEFRRGLRAWLANNLADHLHAPGGDEVEQMLRWQRALAEAGYVAVSFPAAYGGHDLPPVLEAVVNQELATAGAPPPPPVGHIGHALLDHGSAELKERFLPGLLTCRESWCQGFSEPGAGSDLASVSTTGVVDEEAGTVRVTGQKIWTSGALWSRWCLLLLRTEPDKPRHKGLSMIVVEMTSPGIERRQITMSTGGQEFAEVFFDGVEVPLDQMVGPRGGGWAAAMSMLSFERGPADMGFSSRIGRDLAEAERRIREGEVAVDAPARRRFAELRAMVTVLNWHVDRSLANRGTPQAPDASVDKLFTTRVEQAVYPAILDLTASSVVHGSDGVFDRYLYSRAQSIYGGTQQVQRNVVAQRLLGLPRG
jgi:alkylation response protein AidB-like acyl-CoA dehydrogenase